MNSNRVHRQRIAAHSSSSSFSSSRIHCRRFNSHAATATVTATTSATATPQHASTLHTHSRAAVSARVATTVADAPHAPAATTPHATAAVNVNHTSSSIASTSAPSSSASAIAAAYATLPPHHPSAPLSPLPRLSSSSSLSPSYLLGIESSCDDTCMCIMNSNSGEVMSSAHASQWELFSRYGGIHPLAAAVSHRSSLASVYTQALTQAGMSEEHISAVAVTIGPGLADCLKAGVEWATAFASERGLPIVGVHHMRAHVQVAEMQMLPHAQHMRSDSSSSESDSAIAAAAPLPSLPYPHLALLISGGHTELWLCSSAAPNDTTILARTVDDAVGEAFDKAARLLQLQRGQTEPPAAALERYAAEFQRRRLSDNGSAAAEMQQHSQSLKKVMHTRVQLPQPRSTFADFSFAGLKSALARAVFQRRFELLQQQRAKQPPTTETTSSPLPPLPTKLGNAEMRQLMREHKQEAAGNAAIVNAAEKSADGSARTTTPTLLSQLPPLPLEEQQEMAFAFQQAAIDQLCSRTVAAIRHANKTLLTRPYVLQSQSSSLPSSLPRRRIEHLIVAGGVACNRTIRTALASVCSEYGVSVLVPPPEHCTDNAIMIAWTGLKMLRAGITHPYQLKFQPRWPIGEKINMTMLQSVNKQKKQQRQRMWPHSRY